MLVHSCFDQVKKAPRTSKESHDVPHWIVFFVVVDVIIIIVVVVVVISVPFLVFLCFLIIIFANEKFKLYITR